MLALPSLTLLDIDTERGDESDKNGEECLKFDISALKRIAVEKLKKRECTSIRSLGEGTFHKVYLLTMDDGFECVGRLASPYFRRYKTESEVATMQFVAEQTSIRVPEVYAWDSDPDNDVGAEYILMEKISGAPLTDSWTNLSLDEKKHIICQVIDIVLQLFHITFDRIGSLYKGSSNYSYEVGLIVNDLFFDGKRGSMDLDRGPWDSTGKYLTALVRSASDYVKAPHDDDDDDYDDDDDEDILDTCAELERIIPFFCPTDAALERFCLQHTDLHLGNIMVEGNEITGIIDWESAGVYPAWECAQYPHFLKGRGISVKASDADRWCDQKEFHELLEDTNLRSFFRSEIASRDRVFGTAMSKGGKFQMFRKRAILVRDLPGHTKGWIERLSNGSDNWDYDPFSVDNLVTG